MNINFLLNVVANSNILRLNDPHDDPQGLDQRRRHELPHA